MADTFIEFELRGWRFWKTKFGVHLAGFKPDLKLRWSSPIAHVVGRQAYTESGNCYKLIGDPLDYTDAMVLSLLFACGEPIEDATLETIARYSVQLS